MKIQKLDLRSEMKYRGNLLFSAIVLVAVSMPYANYVHADKLLLLEDSQLDEISAGAAEQLVTAEANSTGLVSLTGAVTGAGAANTGAIPGVSIGGAGGGGGAVACCANEHTNVSGVTGVPGPISLTGAQTQTFSNQGLSITIGLFGGAGTGP